MNKIFLFFVLFLCCNISFSQTDCDTEFIFKNPLGFPGSYSLPNDVSFITDSRAIVSFTKCNISFDNTQPGFTTNLPSNQNDEFISFEMFSGSTYLRLNDQNPNFNSGNDVIGLRSKFEDVNNGKITVTAFLKMQNLHINHAGSTHSPNPDLAPHFQVVIRDVLNNAIYLDECIESSDLNLINPSDLIYESSGFDNFEFQIPATANGRDVFVDFIAADCIYSIGKDYAMAYLERICLENSDSPDPFDPCDPFTINITTEFPDCNIFQDSSTFQICGTYTALEDVIPLNAYLTIYNNSAFTSVNIPIDTSSNTVSNGIRTGTFCVTLNQNDFVSTDDYELSAFISAAIPFQCSDSSEIFSIPLNPCKPIFSCGLDIETLVHLNPLGDENLVFYSLTNVSSGWTMQNISFQLFWQNGMVTYHTGFVGAPGYAQTQPIPVSCNNRVLKVVLTITGSNGSETCTDSMTKKFWVCGTKDYDIKNPKVNKTKVYPNPTQSTITFEGLDKTMNHTVTIVNSKGEKIYNGSSSEEIDLSNEISGMYFYIITDEKGKEQRGKIILEK